MSAISLIMSSSLHLQRMSALLKVFRCGPGRNISFPRGVRPALTNLGRRKPRGSLIGLWGKCADAWGNHWIWLRPIAWLATDPPPDCSNSTEGLGANAPERPDRRRQAQSGLAGSTGSSRCHSVNDGRWQEIYHAACSLGGARDIGFCPRRNISMMRIGLPQQGHGSRRVSGAISVCGSGTAGCSGC